MFRRAATLSLSALLLAACGTGNGGATGGSSGTAGGGEGEKLSVVVGFYPLQYATSRIGGDRVEVTNLTKPGAEPHDTELTPGDVAKMQDAELAVYEKGMQPALDDAVESESPEHALDVSTSAQLDAAVDQPIIDLGGEDAHDHGHDDHAHESEAPTAAGSAGADEHEGHAHEHAEAGSIDPHFWLDPVRYGAVAKAIADQLTAIDPEGKSTYEAGLAALKKDLDTLDADYKAGLKTCESNTLVTSHAAFGYLAARYGFTQAAISGLSPESEPDPQRLAKVADYAKKNHVETIYAETLISPAVAETVAKETGANLAVLDPIEGITKDGTDYLSIMRTNLDTLKKGQSCS